MINVKRIFPSIAISILVVIFAIVISFFTDKNTYGQWVVHNKSIDTTIAWIPFTWAHDTLGGKFYDKTAMFVEGTIKNIPYTFQFQFDIGSNITVLNEKTLQSLYKGHPELDRNIDKLKSRLQFWKREQAFKDLSITMGTYQLSTDNGYLMKNYGSEEKDFSSSAVKIGSLGADVFRNKVLIIDYPGRKFCILDSVPAAFKQPTIAIEISSTGRILLPMEFKGKKYKVMYDNGSSMFQLFTTDKRIQMVATSPDIDTIPVTSWGTIHPVKSKLLDSPFTLAGLSFQPVKVYAENRENIDRVYDEGGYDFVTGNALFWNDIIIVDFKNKKFGMVSGELSIVNRQ